MAVGDNPNSKANLQQGPGRWQKGMGSPNPGGRVSIVKALEDRGLDARSLTAEITGHLIDGMRELDKTEASWRFCVEQLANRLMGKPKETVQIEGGAPRLDVTKLSDEQLAVLAEIVMPADDGAPTEH